MSGVSFDFQDKELALNISAHPQLLSTQAFAVDSRGRRVADVPNDNSLFANYAQFDQRRLSHHAQVLPARWVGDSVTTFPDQRQHGRPRPTSGHKVVRLMSSVT
jgi:hypothetical protein